MRRSVFPVPPGLVVVLVAGTIGSVVLHTVGYFGWPYGDWAAASAETHQALTLAGPWVAGCCAWTAARFTGARGILCPVPATRSGFALVRAQLQVLYGWAIAGYLVGLAPLLIATTVTSDAGAFNVLVCAGSLAALLAFASVGYFLGCMLPISLATVIAVIFSFAVVLWADPLGPVAPVWTFGVVVGQYENPIVAVLRLFFFILVGVCCVAGSAWWVRERTLPLSATPMTGMLLLILPLSLGAAAAHRSPPAVLHETNPPKTCTEASGAEVCVHAAKSVLLSPLAESVNDVRAALGPADFPVDRVLDAALWIDPSPPATVVLQLQTQQSRGWRNAAIQDMAWQLSGSAACSAKPGAITSDDELDAAAMSGAVSLWLASEAGANGPGLTTEPTAVMIAERLEQLPVSDVQSLLTRWQPQLMNCMANSSLLP